MFEYLSGKLVHKTSEYCVLDVGGVGFRIYTSAYVADTIGNTGDTVKFYTYLNVKEDELSLFGFASSEELKTFELLITVSGVGPKVAIAILSAMTPSDFCLSVSRGDYKSISKSKGVGPKLAQRIILELKDRVQKDMKAGSIDVAEPEDDFVAPGYKCQDAVDALMVLGYSGKDAAKAVNKVYEQGMSLETVVRLALKNGI